MAKILNLALIINLHPYGPVGFELEMHKYVPEGIENEQILFFLIKD